MNKISREMERSARAQQREIERRQRAQIQAVREAERTQREFQRAQLLSEKERKRLYAESRLAEVASQNELLDRTVCALEEILVDGLRVSAAINFDTLRSTPTIPALELGNLATPGIPPVWTAFEPSRPHPLAMILPWVGKKYRNSVAESKNEYELAHRKFEDEELRRLDAVKYCRKQHAQLVDEAERESAEHNSAVEAFRLAFEKGDADAVAAYFVMVLGSSPYPDGFPQTAIAQFVTESKQLVVAYDLPTFESVVPAQKSFKYVKASDTIMESARPESQRRALYTSIVCQTVLRSIHEIYSADSLRHIDTIVFNGYVNAIDRGNGKRIHPCLVTVRTSRDIFEGLDLEHVESSACLRTLNASVSKSAAELAPVRPVLELNMSDPRFITEDDVLSTLDQRPNLMDLSPGEFESLITNLFQAMGLETKQTQASRDGGVDCVAFDPRPIFGGKVVIQAKRYKNTVGVSAVRDLFGTMQNEGASKGILVTTSGYGKAAFDFANGKPIELLGGSNLLYLLQEHAGTEAKIVMPDDWEDTRPDA